MCCKNAKTRAFGVSGSIVLPLICRGCTNNPVHDFFFVPPIHFMVCWRPISPREHIKFLFFSWVDCLGSTLHSGRAKIKGPVTTRVLHSGEHKSHEDAIDITDTRVRVQLTGDYNFDTATGNQQYRVAVQREDTTHRGLDTMDRCLIVRSTTGDFSLTLREGVSFR